jgi:hypothetical protein
VLLCLLIVLLLLMMLVLWAVLLGCPHPCCLLHRGITGACYTAHELSQHAIAALQHTSLPCRRLRPAWHRARWQHAINVHSIAGRRSSCMLLRLRCCCMHLIYVSPAATAQAGAAHAAP